MSDPRVITLACRLNAFEFAVTRRHAFDAGRGINAQVIRYGATHLAGAVAA